MTGELRKEEKRKLTARGKINEKRQQRLSLRDDESKNEKDQIIMKK